MLLALLPLLLLAPDVAACQGLGPSERPTYEGPHCSFTHAHSLRAREFGTGWGVVAETYDETADPARAHAWFRVTSILSDTAPEALASDVLGLERQDLAGLGWAIAESSEAVSRPIDGAERSGMRYSMTRTAAAPAAGTFTLYAWRKESAVILVRTISLDPSEAESIDISLDSLKAPGIRSDSQRKVGSPEFGFRIPANWQSGENSLGSGYMAYTVVTPDGNVEFLLSPLRSAFSVPQERNHMMETSASRLVDMEVAGQGSLLDTRVAWLNVEGAIISGVIRRWKDPQGNLFELPSFTFVPEGLTRAIQIQANPAPGKVSDMLGTLTRMTRLDAYRKDAVGLAEETLTLPGLQLAVPRGMTEIGVVGDGFAGGSGAVFGDPTGTGPQWMFWSLPDSVEDADLDEKQAAWMQQWLDRDFPGGEVVLRQTMDVDFLIQKPRQGLAWTVDHAPLVETALGDWVPGGSTRWMCALVAIPLKDRTLLAALRVDDRDKFPMLDDFRAAVARVTLAGTDSKHVVAEDFRLELPEDGAWSALKHVSNDEEIFTLLRPGGLVRVKVEHFSEAAVPERRVANNLAEYRKSLSANQIAPGKELQEFHLSIPGRLGERDVRWQRLLYSAKAGGTGKFLGTGWRKNNTWVSFLVDCRDTTTRFMEDVGALAPDGGVKFGLVHDGLTYAGLRLPRGGGFDWIGGDNTADQALYLTYLGQEDVPVMLEFRADPGPQVSDEDLLLSLLPDEPVWDVVVANGVDDVEREVFGRKVKGKRRRGKGNTGPYLWQEVFVDRHDGALRILRLDGPRSHYEVAEPVLKDLLALIQPDGAGLVLTPKATMEVTIHDVGKFRLAIPEGINSDGPQDGQDGYLWSNAIGSKAISLFQLAPEEKVMDALAELLDDGRKFPVSVADGANIPVYSMAVKVGDHILPGIACAIGGVPGAGVMFTVEETNILMFTFSDSEEESRALLLAAMSELELSDAAPVVAESEE